MASRPRAACSSSVLRRGYPPRYPASPWLYRLGGGAAPPCACAMVHRGRGPQAHCCGIAAEELRHGYAGDANRARESAGMTVPGMTLGLNHPMHVSGHARPHGSRWRAGLNRCVMDEAERTNLTS